MITFGNINFILKTSTVAYIAFEETTAVKVSCQCDYLDKYPVTIRPVLNCADNSTSIENCILDQIIQSDNPVEEEVQINTFMRLLDMENLDDYIEIDDPSKTANLSEKALLEIGNEEIIAAEDDLLDSSEEGADVDAIEKQALNKKYHGKRKQQAFVTVDGQTARLLKLSGRTLGLSKLPQLQIVVRDCRNEKLGLLRNKLEFQKTIKDNTFFQQGKIINLKHCANHQTKNDVKKGCNSVYIEKTEHDAPIANCETLVNPVMLEPISRIKEISNKNFKNMTDAEHNSGRVELCQESKKKSRIVKDTPLQRKNLEIKHLDLIPCSDVVSSKYNKRVPYVGLVKLQQKEIEKLSNCKTFDDANSAEWEDNYLKNVGNRREAVKEKEEVHNKMKQLDFKTERKKYSGPSTIPAITRNDCFPEMVSDQLENDCVCEHTTKNALLDAVRSEDINDVSKESNYMKTGTDTIKHKENMCNVSSITITESVPDIWDTVEIGPDLSANSIQSDEEGPLVIDLPAEQTKHDLEKPQGKANQSFVFVDSKSAALLSKLLRHDNRLYLADLPCLKIKVKRLLVSEYKYIKCNEITRKSKPLSNRVSVSTSVKKREMVQDRPRKTDLEKIDNKFLPAGSKLKAQAKAKYRPENSNKNKHVPVPQLPIELKAHLNTSFKIPKKHVTVKPQSIERNPSELNCLHKDQTEAYRKRFQKERRQWEDRSKKPGPCEKKLKRVEHNTDSAAPDYSNLFYENCDSQNKARFSHNVKSDALCNQFPPKAPAYEDIWDIPTVRSKVCTNESIDLLSVSGPRNTLLDSNETDVMSWGNDKKMRINSEANSSAENRTNNKHYEARNAINSDRFHSSTSLSKQHKTLDDGESWSPEANLTIDQERTQTKFNLEPECQPVRRVPEDIQYNPNTTMDVTDMWDSESPPSQQQISPRAKITDAKHLTGEMWDEEMHYENIPKKSERHLMQNEFCGKTSPIMRNKEAPKQHIQSQDRYRKSPVRSSVHTGRSRSPHFDRRQHSVDRSLHSRSPVWRRDSSFNNRRSRSRSPRNDNRSPIQQQWKNNDRSRNQRPTWSHSNSRSRDRSPLNSRHSINRAPLREGRSDGRLKSDDRRSDRSSIARNSPSFKDEYNRNLERIMPPQNRQHSPAWDSPRRTASSSHRQSFSYASPETRYSPQNRQNSPDSCWDSPQRTTPISYQQSWSYGSPKTSCSPSERQNLHQTSEWECLWDDDTLNSSATKKPYASSPLLERESSVSKYITASIQKNENQSGISQHELDCAAYSPSNAWDAISSDEDGDFTTSRVSRNIKSETIPLLLPKTAKSAQIAVESCTSESTFSEHSKDPEAMPSFDCNFNRKGESKPSLVANQNEVMKESSELEVTPENSESVYLQSVTLQGEDSSKTKNVLEHLKQRAERLKQLEEMKLARQKLLAQIKLKNDKVLHIEPNITDDMIPSNKSVQISNVVQEKNSGIKTIVEETTVASSPIAPTLLFETAGTLLSHLDSMLSRPAPKVSSALSIPSTPTVSSGQMPSIPPLPREAPPPPPPADPLENVLERPNCMLPATQWHTPDKRSISIPNINLSLPPPHVNPLLNLQNTQQTQFVSTSSNWQPHSQPNNVWNNFRDTDGFSAPRRSNFDNRLQEELIQLRPPEEIRQNKFNPRQRRYTQEQGTIRDPRQNTEDSGLGIYSRHNNSHNFNRNSQFQRFGTHQSNKRFQQNNFNRNMSQFSGSNFRRNNFRNFEEDCSNMNVPGQWFD
ncbi:uncharacterized protein LOC128736693 [Sabethes cyaneus]|uniref:uncharacterized protein LOC128736693 n=1 Tax=Sabethes cyaneus TaxID=53552 RepID=UPI00237E15AC|nr:uncharacterized protein LOC128736693 [Sabethes cyaneus]